MKRRFKEYNPRSQRRPRLNILLCTLGSSWAVVPEIWGMFPGNAFELYEHHPAFGDIVDQRTTYDLRPVDRIVCISTWGESVKSALQDLHQWRQMTGVRIDLHRVGGTRELDSAAQCLAMKEAIFRHVLFWREQADRLYLSLAGGRKTMSADLQRAAGFFGCAGLFHVVDKKFNNQTPRLSPEALRGPVQADIISCFMPIYMGREPGHRMWNQDVGDCRALRSLDFPISEEKPSPAHDLQQEVERRYVAGESLLVNFAQNLMRQDLQNTFLALYRLSPDLIDVMKNKRFGVDPSCQEKELRLLRQLPKAELHCHLGGVADAIGLIRIACANKEAVQAVRNTSFHAWSEQLQAMVRHKDLKGLRHEVTKAKGLCSRFDDVPAPLPVAALILAFVGAPELLDECIFGPLQSEETFCGIGIAEYEKLGDLQGSSLLQSEASLRTACHVLKDFCQCNTVRYLELRCSPEKYTKGGLASKDVVRILLDELADCPFCVFRLIFIASRHGCIEELKDHVTLALALLENRIQAVVGFDLAGDESVTSARALRDEFMPLMEKCLSLTIHAGETMEAQSIWEAVYHLSADRIGHGLKLVDAPDLMTKVRDRRIALEMCPSSNFQIVGFRDNYVPDSWDKPVYPLQVYMKAGLRVTVNTDNPGISRTDPTKELHRACRLTPGGLSLWDVLILIRQGFRSIFAQDVRRDMLIAAEDEIVRFAMNIEVN